MTKKLAFIVALATVGFGAAHAQNFDPIATRQAGQDLMNGTFAGIRAVIAQHGNVKALEQPAKAMARWMSQYPGLFPPGSDHGDNTKALPAIWSDPAGFHSAADHFVAEANKLAMLAKADDAAAIPAQAKAVGEACLACHKKFKAK
jgi:cytochrome c556